MTVMKNNIQSLLPPSPEEMMPDLASKAKALRLAANLTQDGLASRSGVSLGTIKHFERTGEVSLKSLLNIALALHRLEDFESVFCASDVPQTLFTEEKRTVRQRGRLK